MMPCLSLAQVQEGAPGITKRTILHSFNASAPACTPPSGLKRALTFVQENEREFLQGVAHGLALAAKSPFENAYS
jgi:ribose transport system substrate-binding protein